MSEQALRPDPFSSGAFLTSLGGSGEAPILYCGTFLWDFGVEIVVVLDAWCGENAVAGGEGGRAWYAGFPALISVLRHTFKGSDYRDCGYCTCTSPAHVAVGWLHLGRSPPFCLILSIVFHCTPFPTYIGTVFSAHTLSYFIRSLINLVMERSLPERASPRGRRSRGFVTQNACTECRRRRAKVVIQSTFN